MFDWWKGFESASSSSQANEVKELRRDKERTSSMGLRDEGVKGALLRSVSVNLAELSPSPRLRRTRRRVFKIKYFWFMGKIVTGGVGQMRTYGPRGQVEGGRGPSVAPNLADSGVAWPPKTYPRPF